MRTKKLNLIHENKVFVYFAISTLVILSIPLVMTSTSKEWNWSILDFTIVGVLLFGMGSLFFLIARVTDPKYRLLIGLGFSIALLLIYTHLAVGIVDSWPLAGS